MEALAPANRAVLGHNPQLVEDRQVPIQNDSSCLLLSLACEIQSLRA
jgi:hypothetical protein